MADSLIQHWCYRGEGNRSLVIANTREGIVYRIVKSSSENLGVNELKTLRQDVERMIEFVNNVMCPLVGSVYLTPMTLVTVSEEFVRAVKDIVYPHRPVYRLHKGLITNISLAIQLPDLCRTLYDDGDRNIASIYPTISVEIKPKWGFMPGTDTEVMGVKKSHCRFCMHQLGKDSSDRYIHRSEYCPIDLFSGCSARIKSSLRRLLKSPQNNLCLFSDGNAIWNEGIKKDLPLEVVDSLTVQCIASSSMSRAAADLRQLTAIDNLLDLVTRCLLRDCTTSSQSSANIPSPSSRDLNTRHCSIPAAATSRHQPQLCQIGASNSGHMCSEECPLLPDGCILEKILTVQKLDDLDIEGLRSHYKAVSNHFKQFPVARELSEVDGPFSNDWLSSPADKIFTDISFSLRKIKEFILSRSAKDCSLFVSIQRYVPGYSVVQDNVFHMTDVCGHKFLCRVAVIDLDPKSFDRIPFYMLEDETVVSKYLQQNSASHHEQGFSTSNQR